MCKMDLPHVILVHLFQFLTESDQKAARQTCKAWYVAARTSFMRKVIKFDNISLSNDDTCPLRTYTNSNTKYAKYFFNKVKITAETIYIWNEIGVNITCLTLKSCDITDDMLLYMLQCCPNIRELVIEFQKFRVGSSKQKICLENLKKLEVSGSCLDVKWLIDMFAKKPALEQFHISIFCSRILKEDRLSKEAPPEFDYALDFITSSAKSLKTVTYINPLITATNLKKLLEVKELELQSLDVYLADLSNPIGVQALTNHQIFLRKLNLSFCNHTDNGLAQICRKLVNLECLNIQGATVTDVGIIQLVKLKLLKSLNLSYCTEITKIGFQHGICTKFNRILKELYISDTNLCESGIIMLSERLSLRILDVSSCSGINDTSIKSIIKNQVYLHTLIMHNVNVSDVGLTDPVCSIGNLKCLRELDIRNNYKITDVSLRSFKFEELCKLNMTCCERFTRNDGKTPYGIQGLVEGCPNIEYLNLINCMWLKKEEKVVREIVKELPRLKQLML